MSLQFDKIKLLEELAGVWNDAGFDYGVANGLQGYPETIGRDLDVVFPADDVAQAVETTIAFFEKHGFFVLPYKLGWPHWIVGIRQNGESYDSVQVDIFDHLQWAFCWVVDGLDPVREKVSLGPFQIDPWASVGKRVFLNGLSGNFETFEKKPWYLETTKAELKSLRRNLLRISGSDDLELREALTQKNLAGMESGFARLRARAMRFSFRPQKLLKRLHLAWLKQYCFNLRPRYHTPLISLRGETKHEIQKFGKEFQDLLQKVLPFAVDLRSSPFVEKSLLRILKRQHRLRRSSALIELVLIVEPKALQASMNNSWILRSLRSLLKKPDLKIEVSESNPAKALCELINWLAANPPVANKIP